MHFHLIVEFFSTILKTSKLCDLNTILFQKKKKPMENYFLKIIKLSKKLKFIWKIIFDKKLFNHKIENFENHSAKKNKIERKYYGLTFIA